MTISTSGWGGDCSLPTRLRFAGSGGRIRTACDSWPTLGLDGGRRTLAPAAWFCEALRSVTVAAPIEPVVDPPLDHLDVAVAPGKRVAGEEWGTSWNNKCPILQP
jgi:hypothetical protein